MKSIRSKTIMKWMCWAAQIMVTLLFLKSGWDKIIDPETFARSIQGYQLVPDRVIVLMTWVLPWLELWCAIALWTTPLLRKSGWILLILMLSVFTVAKFSAVVRGLDISCGCTTSGSPLTWWSVATNVIWIGISLIGSRRDDL